MTNATPAGAAPVMGAPGGAPSTSGAPLGTGSRRPTTLGYWLAVAIIVAGLIGSGVIAVATGVGAYDRLADFPRADVPGELTVDVDDAGNQLVYYLGTVDTSRHELGLEVTGPDGQPVHVTNYIPAVRAATLDHHDDLHWGVAGSDEHRIVVASFNAGTSGRYVVTTTGAAEDGAELAVGENLVRPVVVLLAVAAGVALAGLAGGVVLFVVTGVRRSRARAV